MRILIAFPPLSGPGTPMLTQNRQFQWYNFGSYLYPIIPAYAFTMLQKQGHSVYWKDAIAEKLTTVEFEAYIEEIKPELVLFETKTPVIQQHWKIINRLKKKHPSCKIALAGDHVTVLPEESMKKSLVDYTITGGDFDFLFVNIARYLQKKEPLEPGIWYREGATLKNSGHFILNHDLDSLPPVNRYATKYWLYGGKWKRKKPYMYIMSARDCYWNKCTFCSWTSIFPQYRKRTVENVLDEIGLLISQYNVKEIFDDAGSIPGEIWLKEFCLGMIKRGYNKKIIFSCNIRADIIKEKKLPVLMKQAGFRKVVLGLESANQKTLDLIKKGITVQDIILACQNVSAAKIDVHLTVMIGYPWETKQETCKTIELARWLMSRGYAEMLQGTIITPYPSTRLFREAKKNNWFTINPQNYSAYDMRKPILKNPHISAEEIMKLCQKLYKCFYTPQFVLKQLLKIRNIHDIKYLLVGAKAVIAHILDFQNKKPFFKI